MNSDITTALIGVGATIAGTVLGWVLNNLSNRGKLNIYVSSWEDKFQYNDDIGEMVSCFKREEVQSYTYKVSFDLYNSSGNTKIMRNIQIAFSDGKRDIEKQTPQDDAKELNVCHCSSLMKLQSIASTMKTEMKFLANMARCLSRSTSTCLMNM